MCSSLDQPVLNGRRRGGAATVGEMAEARSACRPPPEAAAGLADGGACVSLRQIATNGGGMRTGEGVAALRVGAAAGVAACAPFAASPGAGVPGVAELPPSLAAAALAVSWKGHLPMRRHGLPCWFCTPHTS